MRALPPPGESLLSYPPGESLLSYPPSESLLSYPPAFSARCRAVQQSTEPRQAISTTTASPEAGRQQAAEITGSRRETCRANKQITCSFQSFEIDPTTADVLNCANSLLGNKDGNVLRKL